MDASANRQDHLIAHLAALAILIHVAEAALPSPLPGVKPGLANVITILAMVRYGWNTAAWVSLLRVIAGSLFLGTFMSPTFLLSLAGALSSILVLRLAALVPGLGPVGLSIIAALAHMTGQFLLAWSVFLPHPAMIRLLPVLMTAALVFGTMSGIIAAAVNQRLPPPVPIR